MNVAVINVKTTPETKKEAKKIADELGLSLSSLINALIKQVIRTKSVTLSVNTEEPNKYLIESLKKSKDDIKKGRVSPTFDNPQDSILWLNDKKRTYNRKKIQNN